MKEYQDFYFRKAKAENYPARSIYKLKELDGRFGLLKKGMKALDLGAAPGSWSLGAAEKAGAAGKILACDIKPVDTPFPPQVIFLQEDIFNISDAFASALRETGPFDLVMSDMAPATTGNKFTDQARSYNLACAAFEMACANLKANGNFVVKIFMSPDVQNLAQAMRGFFKKVKTFKPKSSRAESKETFLVGLEFIKPVEQKPGDNTII